MTIQCLAIFVQAILFDIQIPTNDNKTCKALLTESTCLEKKTVLDHSLSYCYWQLPNNSCEYAHPEFSLMAIVYVIIITTVITALFKIPIDRLTFALKCPVPDSASSHHEKTDSKSFVSWCSWFSGFDRSDRDSILKTVPELIVKNKMTNEVLTQQSELDALCPQVLRCRLHHFSDLAEEEQGEGDRLRSDQLRQRQIFDQQWNLDGSLDLHSLSASASLSKCAFPAETLKAFRSSIDFSQKEARRFEKVLASSNDMASGIEILHLFVQDLLGTQTRSARVFRNKFNEDFPHVVVLSRRIKVLAGMILLILNLLFILFTLLRGLSKGLQWQYQFLYTVGIQLAIEVFLFETIECVWMHFVIPDSIRRDVSKVITLLEMLASDHHTAGVWNQSNPMLEVSKNEVDASSYFFVSKRLAQHRKDLRESQLVLSYSNRFPGLIVRVWPHYQRLLTANDIHSSEDSFGFHSNGWLFVFVSGLSGAVAFVLQSIGVLPFLYQRLIIRLFSSAVYSGLILMWILAIHTPWYFIVFAVVTIMVISALIFHLQRLDYLNASESSEGSNNNIGNIDLMQFSTNTNHIQLFDIWNYDHTHQVVVEFNDEIDWQLNDPPVLKPSSMSSQVVHSNDFFAAF